MLHCQFVFAKNLSLLVQFIFASGYFCTYGEAFRTQEQAIWDVKHHTGILHSLHCERLAADINIFSADHKFLMEVKDYEKFGKYWESLHKCNRWGGRFSRPDADHFEMNPVNVPPLFEDDK